MMEISSYWLNPDMPGIVEMLINIRVPIPAQSHECASRDAS